MQYYLKNVKDVLTAVCSEEKGLTQGEAEKRLAQPGGSIRDDLVIEACDKHKMVMAMTGMRLFHH